jgi:hypothetical protein
MWHLSGIYMAEYRLYFLDRLGRILAREEFEAPDDGTALRISAVVAKSSDDVHHGFMLWRGARRIFETGQDSRAYLRGLAAAPLDGDAQAIIRALNRRLLDSHWAIARSQRLLDATSAAPAVGKLKAS